MKNNRSLNRSVVIHEKNNSKTQLTLHNSSASICLDMNAKLMQKGTFNQQIDFNNKQINVKLGSVANLQIEKEAKDIDVHQNINWKKQFYKQMNFQYFFATLKENPVDLNNSFVPTNDNLEADYSDDSTFTSKKSAKDNEWKCLAKISSSMEENNRRRSGRIQQKQEREKLENQMREMRFFYNNGRYRYQMLEVRLRLSFLDANWQKFYFIDNQYANVSDLPQFSDNVSKKRFIEQKRQSLKSRSYYQY